MAQQGYGLSNAVGGFFDTYFKAKQLRQREDQFNKQMAEEQRQSSLLNEYRMATLKPKITTTTVKRDNTLVTYEHEEGASPSAGRVIGESPIREESTPELTTTMIRQGKNFVTYEHQKGASPTEGRVLGESPIREESSSSSNGLTEYQRINQEEKKLARIEKNNLTMEWLIGAAQQGKVKIKDSSNNEREVYKIGDTVIDPELWKPKANSTINALLKDYGLVGAKNQLITDTKKELNRHGINFDKPDETKIKDFLSKKTALSQEEIEKYSKNPSAFKRFYLKSVLDKNKEIPEEEKTVLYQFTEVYTR